MRARYHAAPFDSPSVGLIDRLRSPTPLGHDYRRRTVKVRPLHDRILVTRIDAEAKTPGGLIIPDTAKEKPQEARVVAVGPGKTGDDGKRAPLDVKPGDRILFGKYTGNDVVIDGEDHLIMREEDVLAILE
jgi:chaperonin GroES